MYTAQLDQSKIVKAVVQTVAAPACVFVEIASLDARLLSRVWDGEKFVGTDPLNPVEPIWP